MSNLGKWKRKYICISYIIGFVWSLNLFTVVLWSSEKSTRNNEQLLKLIKIRSKVQERNISCEGALNFDQWKTISENYQRIRAHSKLKEVSYLPWQSKYPNLKTTCDIKTKFFLWLNSQKTYSFQNFSFLLL